MSPERGPEAIESLLRAFVPGATEAEQGLTLVEFSGMPALEAGKVYELWLIPQQGDPVPAAVFKPDAEGSHVVVLARNLRGVKALAVTAEAGPNGTTAPTEQPQLVGTVG